MCRPTSFEPVNEMKRVLRMRDDQVADLAARARHEVDDARRKPDLVQQIDEPRRDDRRSRSTA